MCDKIRFAFCECITRENAASICHDEFTLNAKPLLLSCKRLTVHAVDAVLQCIYCHDNPFTGTSQLAPDSPEIVKICIPAHYYREQVASSFSFTK
jgi:hypothetical protein